MNKKQDRNLYLFLPIPSIIVAVIFFYLFGGGTAGQEQALSKEKSLLNTDVPDESEEGFLGKVLDKLSTYEQENLEELKYEYEKKKDPYSELLDDAVAKKDELIEESKEYLKQPDQLSFNGRLSKEDSLMQSVSEEEKKLQDQLEHLEELMNGKSSSSTPSGSYAMNSKSGRSGRVASSPESRFSYQSTTGMPATGLPVPAGNRTGMQSTGGLAISPGAQSLPPEVQAQLAAFDRASSQALEEENQQFDDMKQMLDKILDIQHPERVKQRLKEKSSSESGNFYSVHNSKDHLPVDYLGEKEENLYRDRYHSYINLNRDTVYKVVSRKMVSGFMGLSSDEGTSLKDEVKAVVHNDEIVTDGSKIKLRLLGDIVVQGREVRANSYIYGICSINGSRVDIEIASVQVAESVVPVNMMVYDHDGMEGIYVSGLAEGAAAREMATNAGTNLDLQLANPTMGGRLIDNSVREVKNLLRRTAQAPKARVKSGHQVFLMNAER
jgi:hypothetical protein